MFQKHSDVDANAFLTDADKLNLVRALDKAHGRDQCPSDDTLDLIEWARRVRVDSIQFDGVLDGEIVPVPHQCEHCGSGNAFISVGDLLLPKQEVEYLAKLHSISLDDDPASDGEGDDVLSESQTQRLSLAAGVVRVPDPDTFRQMVLDWAESAVVADCQLEEILHGRELPDLEELLG